MATWESILEDYLEGSTSCAAVESLRFRIRLPAEARREVEAVLRLTDRLSDATRRATPPADAALRLKERLGQTDKPLSSPKWVAAGSDFVAPVGTSRPGAHEDAVNAAIEGAAIEGAAIEGAAIEGAPIEGAAGSVGHDPASGPEAQSLVEFRRIAAAVAAKSSVGADAMPPGAVERLRAKLAELAEADEGPSAVVAGRILARLRGEVATPPASIRPPDVLAAGKEVDDEPKNQSEGDEPEGNSPE